MGPVRDSAFALAAMLLAVSTLAPALPHPLAAEPARENHEPASAAALHLSLGGTTDVLPDGIATLNGRLTARSLQLDLAGVPRQQVQIHREGSVEAAATTTLTGTFQVIVPLTGLLGGAYTFTASATVAGTPVVSAPHTVHVVVAPPTAPIGLQGVVGPAADQVTLTWNAPSVPGGTIKSYAVYRADPGTDAWTPRGTVDGRTLSFTDRAGVDRTHAYRVSATNLVGEGPVSDSLNVTTPPADTLTVEVTRYRVCSIKHQYCVGVADGGTYQAWDEGEALLVDVTVQGYLLAEGRAVPGASITGDVEWYPPPNAPRGTLSYSATTDDTGRFTATVGMFSVTAPGTTNTCVEAKTSVEARHGSLWASNTVVHVPEEPAPQNGVLRICT